MSYFIHDNGDRPFRVDVTDHSLAVFREKEFETPLFQTLFSRLFVGQGNGTADEVGNSILIDYGTDTYTWIGWKIITFRLHSADAEIVDFKSPIGRNDVPYPYLTTSDNKVYLFLEHAYVDAQYVANDDDVYLAYYRSEAAKKAATPFAYQVIVDRVL